jgi:hypothetical protein
MDVSSTPDPSMTPDLLDSPPQGFYLWVPTAVSSSLDDDTAVASAARKAHCDAKNLPVAGVRKWPAAGRHERRVSGRPTSMSAVRRRDRASDRRWTTHSRPPPAKIGGLKADIAGEDHMRLSVQPFECLPCRSGIDLKGHGTGEWTELHPHGPRCRCLTHRDTQHRQ